LTEERRAALELQAKAKRRFALVCREVRRRRGCAERMERECEELRRSSEGLRQEAATLQSQISGIERDLRDLSEVQSERDDLADETKQLQQELALVQAQAMALQPEASSGVGSFVSSLSAAGSTTCMNRCRQGPCRTQ